MFPMSGDGPGESDVEQLYGFGGRIKESVDTVEEVEALARQVRRQAEQMAEERAVETLGRRFGIAMERVSVFFPIVDVVLNEEEYYPPELDSGRVPDWLRDAVYGPRDISGRAGQIGPGDGGPVGLMMPAMWTRDP